MNSPHRHGTMTPETVRSIPLPTHGVDGILAALNTYDAGLPSFVYERLDPDTRRPVSTLIGLGAHVSSEPGSGLDDLEGRIRDGIAAAVPGGDPTERWPVVVFLGYPAPEGSARDPDVPDSLVLTPLEFLEIDLDASAVVLHSGPAVPAADWLGIIEGAAAEPAAHPHEHLWSPDLSPEEFEQQVQRLAAHFSGDVSGGGAVLSVPVSSPTVSDAVASFRSLRAANPSTCMFLVRHGSFGLWGSTSLGMFELDGRRIVAETDGATRALPQDADVDDFSWTPSDKELHEYDVVAKALQSDIERIAQPGSARFSRSTEKRVFFRLAHLFAEMEAELRPGLGAVDVLGALHPHGAAVGYPRARAIAAIARMESTPRGPFAGTIGLFWSDGSADSAAVTRSGWTTPAGTFTRAGAKIVPESDAAAEYEECVLKTLAVRKTAQPQRTRPTIGG